MDAIATDELKSKFVEFFNAYYTDPINAMYISYPKKRSVSVDIKDLEKFDSDLAHELINKPDTILFTANSALQSMNPNTEATEPVYARFIGLENEGLMIQDVGSQYIGKLLVLDSLVVKRAEITPKVHVWSYKCSFCNHAEKVFIDKDDAPEVCPQCKRRALRQINEDSEFINVQRIAVQDPLERLKGSTPTWQLEVWLADDLVNTIIPGDRIDITGILRIRPKKTARGKEEKTLFTMFFDSVAIKTKQKEFAEIDITDEEEQQIKEMAKDQRIFEKIATSIAPSIYGHEQIKQSLALQLFGGTPDKKLIDGAPIRSDIHILLIGDPGSAKTRLLQAVTSIVPKGIYVSGKSTSSAGLTASAERDEFAEGGWTLKAGALVLGSGGEVSIDEFDKIGDEDKSSLLEALESQTISVAKAGIVARFSAKTTVLAAANPKYGRFDPNTYPTEQFDIPPALLSRFDLIFPIKDVIDEEQDKRIAKHILTQHEAAGASLADLKDFAQVEAPAISADLLRKYVAYAKKNVRPRLSPEATAKIEDYYLELRKIGLKSGATPITARQIEGLVRLAEGSAKSRLSKVIELRDSELAISLFEFMLRTLGVDRGGRRDIDTILTGMPREKVTKMNLITTLIKRLEKEEGGYAKITRVLEEAEKEGVDRATATKYINELERSGDVYSPKAGHLKMSSHENE
ncbi:MAG: minichromosome maintenance protein MCM [Candidatus Micrarchaeota archaeon]|nr:minichromosome maintenance protein MCM [Candidatus Micrarchaeota archaeon]